MSWFKRMNARINSQVDETLGEQSPGGSPRYYSLHDQYDTAPATAPRRLTDTERLGYDAVMLPDHYKKFKIEPIHFCQENGMDTLQTAIIKYVVRCRDKNGVEDLKKAARCLDMMIAFEEGDPDWWRLPGERASRRTYII